MPSREISERLGWLGVTTEVATQTERRVESDEWPRGGGVGVGVYDS